MTGLSEAAITVQDVPHLLSKYRRSILAGSLIGAAVFTAASFVLPAKYKVNFILTIDPRYFQSPLVGEFIPGMGGSEDMKSQGESLLRQSLTPEFLDSLGQKYQLYPLFRTRPEAESWKQRVLSRWRPVLVRYGWMHPPFEFSYELARERQDLISHIEIFNAYGTTYSVGYLSSNPDAAFHAAQEIYAQIIHSLLEVRTRNLVNIRDAIARRLDSLTDNLNIPAAAPPAPGSSKLGLIRQQLEQVRDQIRALSTQYTEEHPVMQELRKKESMLVGRLRTREAGPMTALPEGSLKPAAEGEASREVYSDLTRKLNYLKIAIDSDQQRQTDYFSLLQAPLYPASPLWPKKPLFALWGLLLGLFCSLFIAALREYFDRSALHAETLAYHLQIPLLGGLPAFSWKSAKPTPLIEAPKPQK